ncbi:NAD(P)-dependent oxidoreductase [Pseudomonas protegens]|nr:NAD(P)-dependent oxidoreductase [Pseudomonas protegens]
MSEHLLEAGYSLLIFDTNKQAVEACAVKGARSCDSIAELGQSADIVISMLPDDSTLIKVGVEVLGHIAPGKIFADMSTVSPEASATIGAAAAARGVDYVCAPVSGSTELARKAMLTVFASGPEQACAALDPVFATFSATRYQVGPAHQARYMKLAINHMVGATAALMAEALALGRKGNVDWEVMLEVMASSVIASPLVKYKIDTLKTRNFTPAFSAAQMRKDMGLVSAVGKSSGAYMPLAELVYTYFQDYAQHSPESDFFGVVEAVEAKSDLQPIQRSTH